MEYIVQRSRKGYGYDTEGFNIEKEALRELGITLGNLDRYWMVAYIIKDDRGRTVSDNILYYEEHTPRDEFREEYLMQDDETSHVKRKKRSRGRNGKAGMLYRV